MYGTVGGLKEISQVTVDDLELFPAADQSEESRLDEILTGFLETATEWINIDRERDFDSEPVPVPRGIHSIAQRLAANMVMDMIERQDSKMVGRDDSGNINFSPRKIFTDDLKWELSLYKKGSQRPSASWPRFSRVRSPEQIVYGESYYPEFYR